MKITLSVTLLASLVAFAFASSLADVLADIENGLNQVTALHKTIAALPDKGGSLLSAFVRLVHVVPVDLPLMLPLSMQPLISGGISIVTALNKKTTGVNNLPKPLSEADSNKILTAHQGVEPLILDISSAIVAKRDTFRTVPLVSDLINTIAQYQLTNIKVSGSKFSDALMAVVADVDKDKVKFIDALCNAAVDRAIAAYS